MLISMKITKFIYLMCVFLLSFSVLAADKIEVQALMPGMVVLLIDDSRVTLKTGDQSQGVKLISATSKIAELDVDGVKKFYQMGTTVSTSFKQRELITERIVLNKYGMFKSFGTINGQSVKFLIDTGATSVAMSAKQARKLGIQYRIEGSETRANTASGIAKGWLVTLKSVRLGKLLERNVQGMVIDGDYPQEVLLGMTFLNRMKVENETGIMKITRKK
ncbi:MAG: TIGR02281 family clan AA aspartic protease [endosymbiont of Galathealinum brachiosum]|uniref:TIGR02281 family clan AA aspartic protease n=1 Tax=endosymbiont of Galathealinum brachiosum TaxID=2200906 RepID=A0A370DFN9_9GAMM|nr:MAG: TIGR02281 family clan AA aspartic protease [endosymbiont of Galathealinum brachiosum]